MKDTLILHQPKWEFDGTNWHMLVGNRCAAHLAPTGNCKHLPWAKWVSFIEFEEFEDHGWHAVDFGSLAEAQHDLEEWWFHMCQGEAYRP